MTDEEIMELEALRNQMSLSSLGDRPISIPVKNLRRLIELERMERVNPIKEIVIPFCWVCRTNHELEASKCPGMIGIA